ncbi:MAG: ABC transporter permease [Proteobacteria bacterium]|nr:ABC transporter permease [Pseudomonadota bacterium]
MTAADSAWQPYLAAFRSRFMLMLQYRAAAVAGFVTQCWWGGIKVMVLAAFYRHATAPAAIPLADAITYVWIAQALFALLPWTGDPDLALLVRSGNVAYDRMRPVDCYGLWYARTLGWLLARVLPRAALMLTAAGLVFPRIGLAAWAWQPPATLEAAFWFALAIALGTLLSAAIIVLVGIGVLASLSDRGINVLLTPLVVVLSGNLLPLALFPDALQAGLRWQPFAALLDTPLRLYFGHLAGASALAAVCTQAMWLALLVGAGRLLMTRALARLQVQGG